MKANCSSGDIEIDEDRYEQKMAQNTLGKDGSFQITFANDNVVCSNALTPNSTPPIWKPPSLDTSFLEEAKRRGFTPETCAALLGGTETTQVADSDLPSISYGEDMSEGSPARKGTKELCNFALSGRAIRWETNSAITMYVDEVKRRGYTPDKCAALLGRTGTTQVATTVEDKDVSTQIATVPQPAVPTAQSTDKTPPSINIASSIKVDTDRPTVSGTVSDENNIVQVTVNGFATTLSNNAFSFNRYVPATGTQVTIEAVDEWGNVSTKVVTLERDIVQTAVARFDPLDPTTFSARSNPNAVALIIGIAEYKRTPSAQYADNDATFFADYARRKLGVPANNIKILTNDNAGFIDILEATTDWLPSATRAGRSDVYVFFAGHGLSSLDGEDVFLLPYNGSAKLLEQTALQRTKLFDTISAAKPRSVTVFLDTCYSGTTRTEELLVAQRGIRIVPKEQLLPEGFTVFSAASMTQTATMLAETKHGLFSYWLMKGMEGDADGNSDRQITAGELHQYALANVSRLQRNQTPEMQGDADRVLMAW